MQKVSISTHFVAKCDTYTSIVLIDN